MSVEDTVKALRTIVEHIEDGGDGLCFDICGECKNAADQLERLQAENIRFAIIIDKYQGETAPKLNEQIQAMQEKLGRENMQTECKYCNGEDYRDRNLIPIFDSHDFAEIVVDTDNTLYISNEDIDISISTVKLLYCPICGRKLTSDIVNVNKIENIGEANNEGE